MSKRCVSTRSTPPRPVSTVGSDWPIVPAFHPEFGLLCPSPRWRRRLRLAVTVLLAGIGIAATIELAVAHWRDSDAAAQTRSAGPVDEEPLMEPAAIPQLYGIPVASLPSAASAAAPEARTLPQQGSCKDAAQDLAATFLHSACRPGKAHARRAERAPNRVATVIVGRMESAPGPATVEAVPYRAAAGEMR
jgi:hypothetical protein